MDKKEKLGPREEGVISWDEFFMGVAELAAKRSKDPNTQVGCCIVNEQNHVMATGYNGLPKGLDNYKYPWNREADSEINTKYPYMCHAEQNAIDNRGSRVLDGCTLYVTLFPCHVCVQRVIQNGIREVVYKSDKYNGTDSNKMAKMMLSDVGIKFRQLV